MPHSKLNLKEAALFLHIPPEDLEHLVKKNEIPVLHESGRILFRKSILKEWATKAVFHQKEKKIGKMHYSAKGIWTKTDPNYKLESYLIPAGIEPSSSAKTKPSVLRELSLLANKTHSVSDPEKLLILLINREEEQSTGLTNGVALPHPHVHTHQLFNQSFLIVLKTNRGIPFGSLDGKMTDLFFMPCSMNDEEHIFILGRLSALIKKTSLCNDLRRASSTEDVLNIFSLHEKTLFPPSEG